MRADAARRRAALLREARRLFAETDGDVALEAVADGAGVGIATLYRNFESRAALVEQVGLAILEDIGAATARAAVDLPGSPDAAWRAYVEDLIALDLGALTAALSSHVGDALDGPIRAAQEQSLAAVESLLADVRAAGLVPNDLGALELVVAVGIVTRPQPALVRAAAPYLVDRLVDALLAGLRAEARDRAETAGRRTRHVSSGVPVHGVVSLH